MFLLAIPIIFHKPKQQQKQQQQQQQQQQRRQQQRNLGIVVQFHELKQQQQQQQQQQQVNCCFSSWNLGMGVVVVCKATCLWVLWTTSQSYLGLLTLNTTHGTHARP